MPAKARSVVGRVVGTADGNILLDLFVVEQRVGQLLDAALTGTGVRAAEYAVFSQLGAAALTPGELGARLGTTKSTLAGHLTALERRGLLCRRPHPADGRSHLLELTAGGRRTLEQCRARFRATLAVFESELQHPPAAARVMLLDVDEALARALERLAN
ncbi:MAG: MarR family transcriptional regulator [Nostocoides sp.]